MLQGSPHGELLQLRGAQTIGKHVSNGGEEILIGQTEERGFGGLGREASCHMKGTCSL